MWGILLFIKRSVFLKQQRHINDCTGYKINNTTMISFHIFLSSGAERCLFRCFFAVDTSADSVQFTWARCPPSPSPVTGWVGVAGAETGVRARQTSPRCSWWQRRQHRRTVRPGLQEDQPRPHTKNGYSSHTSRDNWRRNTPGTVRPTAAWPQTAQHLLPPVILTHFSVHLLPWKRMLGTHSVQYFLGGSELP